MEDFEKHVLALSLHFQRREYPDDLILDVAILTRRMGRSTLLQSTNKVPDTNKERIFAITTVHPNDHILQEIVWKNWDILGQSAHTEYIFQKSLW